VEPIESSSTARPCSSRNSARGPPPAVTSVSPASTSTVVRRAMSEATKSRGVRDSRGSPASSASSCSCCEASGSDGGGERRCVGAGDGDGDRRGAAAVEEGASEGGTAWDAWDADGCEAGV
jgi:hypothetical protein